jgi:hypothetical protein
MYICIPNTQCAFTTLASSACLRPKLFWLKIINIESYNLETDNLQTVNFKELTQSIVTDFRSGADTTVPSFALVLALAAWSSSPPTEQKIVGSKVFAVLCYIIRIVIACIWVK